MSLDELTAITFRLPAELREKIKAAAAAEERSESGFIRFHIGQLLSMSDAETRIDEDSTGDSEP